MIDLYNRYMVKTKVLEEYELAKIRPGKSTVLVYLDDDLKSKVQACAKIEHRSVTNMINKMILDYIKDNPLTVPESDEIKNEKEC